MTSHRDEVTPHWLYRCYDAEGRLLYIGCTMDVANRMYLHRCGYSNPASAFLNRHMTRYEVEGPFVGRLSGHKAEREAIGAEAPLLNLHHNKGRGLPREKVEPATLEELREAMQKMDALLFEARA